MPRSEAMAKAIKKYEKESVDHITFRVPKGMKEVFRAHAQTHGLSLNRFLFTAAIEKMELDQKKVEQDNQ